MKSWIEVTRTYRVYIHNQAEVEAFLKENDHSFGELLDACTRMVDAGEGGALYLLKSKYGGRQLYYWDENNYGDEVVYGPVAWNCMETNVEIGDEGNES